MNILNKSYSSQIVTVGRLSDGSDRRQVLIETWTVEFEENGRKYRCTFDHEPTDEEILAAPKEDITEPTDLLQKQIDDLCIAMAAIMGGAV